MHSTSVPLFLIVASLVSTSLGLHHLAVEARRSLEIIFPRQTSDSCTSICTPIESTVGSCSMASCLCTDAVAASLQACINCAISEDPSVSVVSSAQSLIDTFDTTCGTVTGLPSITIATGTTLGTANTSPLPVSTLPGGSITPSTSTSIVVPITTVSQIVIGPSSTSSAANTASSAESTSIGGLPLKSGASPSKVVLHWTGALLGLAAGILLAF